MSSVDIKIDLLPIRIPRNVSGMTCVHYLFGKYFKESSESHLNTHGWIVGADYHSTIVRTVPGFTHSKNAQFLSALYVCVNIIYRCSERIVRCCSLSALLLPSGVSLTTSRLCDARMHRFGASRELRSSRCTVCIQTRKPANHDTTAPWVISRSHLSIPYFYTRLPSRPKGISSRPDWQLVKLHAFILRLYPTPVICPNYAARKKEPGHISSRLFGSLITCSPQLPLYPSRQKSRG